MPTYNRDIIEATRARAQQLSGNFASARGVQSGVRKDIQSYQPYLNTNSADIEQQINSPTYPPELKAAYLNAKASGNFSTFNSAVNQYNASQQTKFQDFEQHVNSPDYPESLRNLYKAGKAKNDLTEFNTAVKQYNDSRASERNAQLNALERELRTNEYTDELRKAFADARAKDDFTGFNKALNDYYVGRERKAAEIQDYFNALNKYYKDRYKPAPLTPEEQQMFNDYMKNPTPEGFRQFSNYVEDKGTLITVGNWRAPEHISKVEYNRIAEMDKANNTRFLDILKETGVTGLNAAMKNYSERQQADYEASMQPYLKDKADYDAWVKENIESDPYLNTVKAEKGEKAAIEAYKKRYADLDEIYEREQKKYQEQEKEFFRWLREEAPRELYYTYTRHGRAALEKAMTEYYGNYETAIKEVAPYIIEPKISVTKPKSKEMGVSGQTTAEKNMATIVPKAKSGTIDIVKYIEDGKDEKYLKALGVTDENIKDAKHYLAATGTIDDYVIRYFKARNWSTDLPSIAPGHEPNQKEINDFQSHYDEAAKSYYETAPEKRPTAIIKELALGMIPVYGTMRYYNRAKEDGLETGEKINLGFMVVGDILTLVPIAGQFSAAARGTFMAGKAGQYISRGVQLREFGKAAGGIVLGEIKAPFSMILHPVETAKAALSPLETLTRWQVKLGEKTLIKAKIPLSAVESKWNTMRIPISMVGGDERTTLQLRDKVTRTMVDGVSSEATVNGWNVRLNPAAINRLGEPLAVSATPDVRPFLNGATIGKGVPVELADGRTVIMGEGKDLFLAPTFHSRFAEATSTGMIPKDPIPGGIILRGNDLVKELESSGKSYAGAAEVESIIKAKKKFKLGEPVQVLVTRTSYGKKLTLLVFGKPFTQAEIGALKFMGSADTLAQIFQVPVKVNGKAVKSYMNAETGFAGNATRSSFRVPIRTVMVNYTNTSLFDDYRKLTGDKRKDIRLDVETPEDKERRKLSKNRKPPEPVEPRLPFPVLPNRQAIARDVRTNAPEYRGRTPPTESRRTLEPQDRRPIISPDRRATAKNARRYAESPDRREFNQVNRRVPPNPPRRSTPNPPTRRTVNAPDNRVPPNPPENRIPPNLPENRVPPNPPDRTPPPRPPKRTPPTPPEKRVPPEPPKPPTPPLPPKPPAKTTGKGKSDKAKREIIKAHGLTTYNMGKLHGKDVWWTHLDTGENMVVLGEKPEGAKITADGPGSADKTTQRIGKQRDFKPFSIRHGAVISRVTPSRTPKGATNAFGSAMVGRSHKEGKIYKTPIGGATGYSRKPIRYRHK